MNTAIEVCHVVIDAHGRAWIDDTNIKVTEIVRDHLAYGWSPEEIHLQHPNLGLAQIYAALAYYHDHRCAMDAEIHDSLASANAASRLATDSPLALRLRGFVTECVHDLHLIAKCLTPAEMSSQVVYLPVR